MNVFQQHRQLLQQHRDQRILGPGAYTHPTQLPNRMLFDISSAALAWRSVRNGAAGECRYLPSTSYEDTLKLAAQEIRAARLRPGSGVVLHLWPPSIRLSAILVGPGQRASSALLLDEIAQLSPETLQLDPLHTYRVLDSGTKKVDLIGLGHQGQEIINAAIPSGISLARLLGPLSAADILLQKISDKISDPTLLCLMEGNRLHYLGIKKGNIVGFRVVSRMTLRDANDLRNTLQSMQIDPASVLFVALTAENSDAEEICRQEAEKNDIDTSMTDQASLALEYPELVVGNSAIPLPLALAATHGASRFSQFLFRTPIESHLIPFRRHQMAVIEFSKIFSSLAHVMALTVVAICIGYLGWQMQRPAWKVNEAEVTKLKTEWAVYNADRQHYAQTLNQIENVPRIDRMAAIFCAPTPPGIILESVKFNCASTTPDGDHNHYQIEGTGTYLKSDLLPIKNYLSQLQQQFAMEYPQRTSGCELKNTTTDPATTLTRFNFTLTVQ